MPTKTKPINTWKSPFLVQVHLDALRRAEVAELLGLNETNAETVLDEIDQILALGTNRIRARESEPLPAHLIAELRPLAEMARRLAEALNRLSSKARMRTRMVSGGDAASMLWYALTEFSTDVSITCDKLERQRREHQEAVHADAETRSSSGSDGGSRKANVRVARQGVRDVLGGIYDRCASAPTARGRTQFLRVITGRRERG